MDFQKLTLAQTEEVRSRLGYLRSNTCDFTVGGMFMWRDYFKMEYAIDDGVFFSRLYNDEGEVYYNLPLCEDMLRGIRRIIDYEKERCGTVRFCTVPKMYLPVFQELGLDLRIESQEDFFDYLYLAEDMKNLAGRKYSGQRNHISQFMRKFENWSFEELTDDNLDDARLLLKGMFSDEEEDSSKNAEKRMNLDVLDNMDIYRMQGGILYADGKAVGFSLGEAVGNTLHIHIEKALRDCRGAHQMLAKQFVLKYAVSGIEYINREDDMGDPGLKRAKMAYHPVELLEKYVVEIKG